MFSLLMLELFQKFRNGIGPQITRLTAKIFTIMTGMSDIDIPSLTAWSKFTVAISQIQVICHVLLHNVTRC